MARPATLAEIWRSRSLLQRLARSQLRDRYSGSALGALWALLQPLAFMAVFWFVFVFGLRIASPAGQASFVAVLLVGLGAWFWFSDTVANGVTAVTGSAYMVKKVAFPLEILPLAPVLASLVVHVAVMIVLGVGLAWAGALAGGWRVMTLPIYMIGLAVLATGLSYWLSALHVFHRDVAQTTAVVLQIWFWLTPIVWSPATFPPEWAARLSWNPMAWVIEGYRHALLADAPRTMDASHAVVFWIVSLALLASGVALFRRMRSDFADTL